MMIFSELYSVYYNAVAKIIERAFCPNVSEKELQECVIKEAFAESVLTIIPSLKSKKWPLLNDDLTPVLKHIPTMPLTTLEKRWLKSISEDVRIKLFGITFPELDDVEPLFTQNDYCIYDRYADGDPFEDEQYVKHFQIILKAIKNEQAVRVNLQSRSGNIFWIQFFPIGMEYSVKDDKIRIVAAGCKYRHFNLGKILDCKLCDSIMLKQGKKHQEVQKELTLLIIDERNTLERAMLHFAHFEKQVEREGEDRYILRLKYYEGDETEIVIRVLSFGPYIKVLAPQKFIELIRNRLIAQKRCELK